MLQLKIKRLHAQAMVLPVPKVQMVEVDELTSIERGAGGFGSTGDGG